MRALERLDHTLLEAASDLGCPPVRAFWKITFPLALPGVIAGCFLVFIPVTGEFVIPDLLGGSDTLMIGKTLWTEFFNNRDWPLSSAVAVILLLILVVPIVIFQNQQQRARRRSNDPHLALQHRLGRLRPRLPLSADPPARHLFLQRLEAGHRLGRLLDPLVRLAASTTRRCSTPPG